VANILVHGFTASVSKLSNISKFRLLRRCALAALSGPRLLLFRRRLSCDRRELGSERFISGLSLSGFCWLRYYLFLFIAPCSPLGELLLATFKIITRCFTGSSEYPPRPGERV
jgi:hypothetical protein